MDFSGKRPVITDPATGRADPRRVVRRRARGQQLRLRRSLSGPGSAAWISAHVRMVEFFGGRPGALRPRQSAERRHQGLPLRARHQPHLSGVRPALRGRRRAGPRGPSARQGGRGGQCARRPALDPRGAAPPPLLQRRRAERGDLGPPPQPQRPPDETPRRLAPPALRAARPPAAAPAAHHPLRAGRVARRQREHRLPRRRRAQLLQRPLPARAPARRGPPHHRHRRDLPQGPPHRLPSPALGPRRSTRPIPPTCRTPTAPMPSGRPRA